MATKKQATPIMDIKSPEKVKPSTTGRPIIVTTHPVLKNDPMVVAGPAPGEEAAEQPATAPALINRTAKTIKPLDPELQAPATDATPADQEPTTAAEPPVGDQPAVPVPDSMSETSQEPTDTDLGPATDSVAETPSASAPDAPIPEAEKPAADNEPAQMDTSTSGTAKPVAATGTDQPAESTAETTRSRDSEAEQRAVSAEEEAARQAREQQLETLITSGKYAVPINAVQRKRSRLFVTVASIIALLLALAVLDVLLDTGLVKLPVNLPHTHFFSAS